MLSREELEELVGRHLQREVEQIFATAPFVNHLIDDSQELNEAYYLRHRVETIKRIRMTSRTDALALTRMIEEEYDAARWWSRYVAQELNHDLLYMKDLRKHGYTDEFVASITPFPATCAMLDYLETEIDRVGSLAAVAYSIWAEWNSERVSARVVERAAQRFSSDHVAGSEAHVGIDEHEDHYAMMLDVAHRLLLKQGDVQILLHLLSDISGFVSRYLQELYVETVAQPVLDLVDDR